MRFLHLFPWNTSGRAIANERDEGVTKLLFDDSPDAHGNGKILSGGMVGRHAGSMMGEIALAIEMGAGCVDIGKSIHPHPTLGESIGMAAEIAHGLYRKGSRTPDSQGNEIGDISGGRRFHGRSASTSSTVFAAGNSRSTRRSQA